MLAALVLWLSTLSRSFVSADSTQVPHYDLVWLAVPGPPGGGSGSQAKVPVRRIGEDQLTVPTAVESKPAEEAEEAKEPPPEPLTIPHSRLPAPPISRSVPSCRRPVLERAAAKDRVPDSVPELVVASVVVSIGLAAA